MSATPMTKVAMLILVLAMNLLAPLPDRVLSAMQPRRIRKLKLVFRGRYLLYTAKESLNVRMKKMKMKKS